MLEQISSVSTQDQIVLAAQILIACVCGAIVGLEREIAGKRAGLRTHMIVAVASCFAIGLGRFALGSGTGDATRVLHGVLTGIGFLGAGAILTGKRSAGAGLTTAATIFLVAILGSACAFGAPILALAGALLSIVLLRGVYLLDQNIRKVVTWGRRHASSATGDDEEDDLG